MKNSIVNNNKTDFNSTEKELPLRVYVNKNILLIQFIYGIATTSILHKTLIVVLSLFLLFLIIKKNSKKIILFRSNLTCD